MYDIDRAANAANARIKRYIQGATDQLKVDIELQFALLRLKTESAFDVIKAVHGTERTWEQIEEERQK